MAIISIFFLSPIPQDQSYHQFADQRTLLSIPNFWNVVSNVGFLFVGAIGFYKLHISNRLNIVSTIKYIYSVFFIGVFFVSFGSAYYHWQPNNHTLIWDRLPMTLAFMSLTSIVFAEFISLKWARVSLIPLLLIGLLSVCYWYWSEMHGSGDLRFYALVQFLPIVLLLIFLV
ncbi:MAG TPA: ceramidase domain-containing protein, partial [Puia sp.]|nr:ceramidase domain-containing protein [Puia sp.]